MRPNASVERLNAVLAQAEADDDIRIVTLDEFVAVEEQGGEAVLGTQDNALIPEGADVQVYGDGGVGKTTLVVDLGCHFAAGDDWLGIEVGRPLRVLVIENEGPRPLFRRKLGRKREAWSGSPIGDRLLVFEEPWGGFSFADPLWRQRLGEVIREHEIDVVIVGPLTASGMNLPGTLQECRSFIDLVDEVRTLGGRRFVNIVVHHENSGGKVSGAWEGVGDTLLHVTQQGRGKLRLYVQKARWSSDHHGTSLQLAWAEGESFTVEEKPELDDEAIAAMILTAITGDPGAAWSAVERETPGVGRDRRNAIRDRLFASGRIVNVTKKEGALGYCQEGRKSRLYLSSDPTIAHLLPARGADGERIAPTWGEGESASTAPRSSALEEERGAEERKLTPRLDLGSGEEENDEP